MAGSEMSEEYIAAGPALAIFDLGDGLSINFRFTRSSQLLAVACLHLRFL